MTDKQIIIHNINVSKCEHITCKYSLNPMCGNTGICCRGRKNCYYKQLKRKEQECNKLKQTLAEIKEIAEKEVKRAPDGETFARPEIKQILQKISECEVNNDR